MNDTKTENKADEAKRIVDEAKRKRDAGFERSIVIAWAADEAKRKLRKAKERTACMMEIFEIE